MYKAAFQNVHIHAKCVDLGNNYTHVPLWCCWEWAVAMAPGEIAFSSTSCWTPLLWRFLLLSESSEGAGGAAVDISESLVIPKVFFKYVRHKILYIHFVIQQQHPNIQFFTYAMIRAQFHFHTFLSHTQTHIAHTHIHKHTHKHNTYSTHTHIHKHTHQTRMPRTPHTCIMDSFFFGGGGGGGGEGGKGRLNW